MNTQPLNNRAAGPELKDKLGATYLSAHPNAIEIPEDRLREVDPESIKGLAESIGQVGLLQPIGVKHKADEFDKYRLIFGARRLLAFRLLLRDAMSLPTSPDPENHDRDNAIFRCSSIPILKFPTDMPDDLIQELEIRENMDRQELTPAERQAHILKLGAIYQRRHKQASKAKKPSDENIRKVSEKSTSPKKGRGRPSKPVTQQVADATGVDRNTLDHRVAAASKAVGKPLDLDTTPPEELEQAAEAVKARPRAKAERTNTQAFRDAKAKPFDPDKEWARETGPLFHAQLALWPKSSRRVFISRAREWLNSVDVDKRARVDPDDKAGAMALDALPLVKECIKILQQPIAGRQTSIAIDHLSRVQEMLERLLNDPDRAGAIVIDVSPR